MTAYLAGLAVLRCAEHPRAGEIDSTARLTLAAMASFVGGGKRHAADPQCLAAHAAIAERAALSPRSVIRAQERLAGLGLIERAGRTGEGLHCTVRWRLLCVTESHKSTPAEGGDTVADKACDSLSDKTSDALSPNPSDVQRPQGSKDRGRSDAADAAASAGATATAATPSTGEGTIVAEVRLALGCSAEHAEKWIEDKIGAASGPVRNRTAFLRRCLAAETEQRSAKADTPTPPRSAKAAKAKPPRRRASVPAAEQQDAVAASRAGEDHDEIAERMNVHADRIKAWRREHDQADARAAVDAGETDDAIVERLGIDRDYLRGHRHRNGHRAALAALRGGVTVDQAAADASAAFGEPVTAETVRKWAAQARPPISLPPPALLDVDDWRAAVFARAA